jgi:hypothetical protein
MGDEFLFHGVFASSKISAHSPGNVNSSTGHAQDAEGNHHHAVIHRKKLILPATLPTGREFNHIYFHDYRFRDLKNKNMNSMHQESGADF